jgi:hypothetical protein
MPCYRSLIVLVCGILEFYHNYLPGLLQEGALVGRTGRGGEASTSGQKVGRKQAAYVGAEPVSAEHLRTAVLDSETARTSRYAGLARRVPFNHA